MKRKLLILACIVFCLFSCVVSASATAKDLLTVEFYDVNASQYVTQTVTTVDLMYDGECLQPDVPAFIDRGRTLVPIYIIGNLLDANVEWNQEFRRAKIETANTSVILTIGSNVALVNGKQVSLPDGIPAALVKYDGADRTMVPWRFVAEQLGARVEWDPDTYSVTLILEDQPLVPDVTPPIESETPAETPSEDVIDPELPLDEETEEEVPTELPKVLESLSDITVVLDAGHGGSDPGASYYSVDEKTVNLSVTERVEQILLDKGLVVQLTRTDDSHVSLSERTTFANDLKANIFVSLHSNAAELAPSASGIETYYYSEDMSGAELAACIQASVIETTEAKNRKTKTANFYVCKNTDMPAVLVEMGFLTNAIECEKLASEEYQQLLAVGIANGILTYAESLLES